MRITLKMLAFLAVGAWCAPVGAEGIWDWTHEASGSGTANVFDGGPPVFDDGQTSGPDDDRMSFLASDRTMSGSLGAKARGRGSSHLIDATEELFRFRVDLTAGYFPSGFPGGDNPGGMAEAEIFSVIEFTMPVDQLQWNYQLLIFEDAPFQGSTSVVMENLTQSEVLLELVSDTPIVKTVLNGAEGERMRITTSISGNGSMGPGSTKEYFSLFEMLFVVPEPGTFSLFLLVAASLAPRQRRRA